MDDSRGECALDLNQNPMCMSAIVEHEENADAFYPCSLESVGSGLDHNRRLRRRGASARSPRRQSLGASDDVLPYGVNGERIPPADETGVLAGDAALFESSARDNVDIPEISVKSEEIR